MVASDKRKGIDMAKTIQEFNRGDHDGDVIDANQRANFIAQFKSCANAMSDAIVEDDASMVVFVANATQGVVQKLANDTGQSVQSKDFAGYALYNSLQHLKLGCQQDESLQRADFMTSGSLILDASLMVDYLQTDVSKVVDGAILAFNAGKPVDVTSQPTGDKAENLDINALIYADDAVHIGQQEYDAGIDPDYGRSDPLVGMDDYYYLPSIDKVAVRTDITYESCYATDHAGYSHSVDLCDEDDVKDLIAYGVIDGDELDTARKSTGHSFEQAKSNDVCIYNVPFKLFTNAFGGQEDKPSTFAFYDPAAKPSRSGAQISTISFDLQNGPERIVPPKPKKGEKVKLNQESKVTFVMPQGKTYIASSYDYDANGAPTRNADGSQCVCTHQISAEEIKEQFDAYRDQHKEKAHEDSFEQSGQNVDITD